MPDDQDFAVQKTLAQQGNLAAIATLLTPILDPSLTLHLARRSERLGVLLEANQVPDRAWATSIQQIIRHLQLPQIQTTRVYGRIWGQALPTWCIGFSPVLSNSQKLYGYFVAEAQELLQELEQDLLSFRADPSLTKIQNMLLAVHTIKGGSASVGLQTIAKVAHGLEDVFAALRQSQVAIDLELENLLIQGYESLRNPLMAEFSGIQKDEAEVLNHAASIIAQMQQRLGDGFNRETPLLTSAELGFDVVHNLFQVSVAQRLGDLERALFSSDPERMAAILREKADVFLGLAESMNLPGFGTIAQTALMALEISPQRVLEITETALADFTKGRMAVLAGDRLQGGFPSVALRTLAGEEALSPMDLEAQATKEIPEPDIEDLFSHLAIASSPEIDLADEAITLSLDEVFGHYTAPL